MTSNASLIKQLDTKQFIIGLYELASGRYGIAYSRKPGKPSISEVIQDYNTVSYLFDLKVIELEGQ